MSVEAVSEALGVEPGPMDKVSITVASPDIIRSWSKGRLKTLRQLIIVLSNLNPVVFSVKKSLDQLGIMSVPVESTKELSTKV